MLDTQQIDVKRSFGVLRINSQEIYVMVTFKGAGLNFSKAPYLSKESNDYTCLKNTSFIEDMHFVLPPSLLKP